MFKVAGDRSNLLAKTPTLGSARRQFFEPVYPETRTPCLRGGRFSAVSPKSGPLGPRYTTTLAPRNLPMPLGWDMSPTCRLALVELSRNLVRLRTGEEGWRICPASLVARVPGKLTLTV